MSTYPTNFIAPLPQARHPEDLATLVFASVIAESMRASRQPLIRGLSESCFQKLLKAYFSDFSEMSGLACSNGEAGQSTEFDQFDDDEALLLMRVQDFIGKTKFHDFHLLSEMSRIGQLVMDNGLAWYQNHINIYRDL